MFKNATNGTEKLIGDSFRAHPDHLVANPKEAEQKIMNGSSHAFFFASFIHL